ncbi:imm11 family protein [Tabrizicola sp.]|uniref:imm11 family protein n=1 Tax=Tabrizicola sp. TaxID=2005166 RepID=UPI002FDEF5FD
MKAGIPIPAEIVPRHHVVTDKRMPVHGFVNCGNGVAVDDRMVSAVEALEPGVHRFHPVEITMKADGKLLPRPQFPLNCCTSVDAIDPENSRIAVRRVLPEETHPDLWHYTIPGGSPSQPAGPMRLAVHRDRIAGRAMWWDNRFNRMFFSDALVAALQTAGVEGIDLSPHVAET